MSRETSARLLMNPKEAFRSFGSVLREHGVRALIRAIGDRLYIRWFEWRLGIRSEAVINLKELGIDNTSCRPYVPTDYHSFQTILDGLEIRSNEDVFLDFGSGMGRAVIMAAKYPFRKIYGVEIARQLNEIARQNVRRALPRLKCRDIELITANAREFVIPDEATVIYFLIPSPAKSLPTCCKTFERRCDGNLGPCGLSAKFRSDLPSRKRSSSIH